MPVTRRAWTDRGRGSTSPWWWCSSRSAAWRLLPNEHSYTADFANASGISKGDDVRVPASTSARSPASPCTAASCTSTSPPSKGLAIARQARAEIKLATILGQHYLDLVPGKGDRLDGGGTIPLAQTKSAYTIDKFQVDANDAVQGLDDKALAGAVNTLSTTLDGNPAANRQALQGIAQVSRRSPAVTTSCAG